MPAAWRNGAASPPIPSMPEPAIVIDLAWEPAVPLDEGFARLAAWFAEHWTGLPAAASLPGRAPGLDTAGMLAAAATHALTHHVERLAQDHALAQRLAEGLRGIDGVQVETPHTNIVFVDLVGAELGEEVVLHGAVALAMLGRFQAG